MPSKLRTSKAAATHRRPVKRGSSFPLELSIGYQIRMTHRLLQRYLQSQIEPHGITLGMWYFLRALWEEDGLTQRELSKRIGTMEPTTLSAIQSMLRQGLVRRVRNKADRRKLHIYLTAKGRGLRPTLLPLAGGVVATATHGFSPGKIREILRLLQTMQEKLGRRSGIEIETLTRRELWYALPLALNCAELTATNEGGNDG
jgi:MarR family transcriptional regulator, organic hydroperoxide resistance regulator